MINVMGIIYLWIENEEEDKYLIMSGAAARTLMERKKS